VNELVQLEITSGIGVFTLNRPESFNAFHAAMIGDLAKKLMDVSSSDDVVGIVLTGAGKAFCAGADLKWLYTCGLTPVRLCTRWPPHTIRRSSKFAECPSRWSLL